MSQAQDRNLGLAERVQLEMHLAICKGCRNFSEQMAFLRKACRAWLDRERRLRDGES